MCLFWALSNLHLEKKILIAYENHFLIGHIFLMPVPEYPLVEHEK